VGSQRPYQKLTYIFKSLRNWEVSVTISKHIPLFIQSRAYFSRKFGRLALRVVQNLLLIRKSTASDLKAIFKDAGRLPQKENARLGDKMCEPITLPFSVHSPPQYSRISILLWAYTNILGHQFASKIWYKADCDCVSPTKNQSS
jgi:hypothetical protein